MLSSELESKQRKHEPIEMEGNRHHGLTLLNLTSWENQWLTFSFMTKILETTILCVQLNFT